MHSDHRRRYHVVPAGDVYPGHTISTDAAAIAATLAAADGNPAPAADVDWAAVEQDASLIHHRHRTRPTTVRFSTSNGSLTREVGQDLLVVRERAEGPTD